MDAGWGRICRMVVALVTRANIQKIQSQFCWDCVEGTYVRIKLYHLAINL